MALERLPNICRISAKNRVNMTSQNWLYLTNCPTDFDFFMHEKTSNCWPRSYGKFCDTKLTKKCKELWETSRVALIPAAAPLCIGRKETFRMNTPLMSTVYIVIAWDSSEGAREVAWRDKCVNEQPDKWARIHRFLGKIFQMICELDACEARVLKTVFPPLTKKNWRGHPARYR